MEIKKIREETGASVKEVNELIRVLGIREYKRHGERHVNKADSEVLLKELGLPDELKIRTASARFIRPARNAHFVYGTVDGFPGKHLIKVTRRQSKPTTSGAHRLKNKNFEVEIIEDRDGVSFRHVEYQKRGLI